MDLSRYGDFISWTGQGYEFFTPIYNRKNVMEEIDAGLSFYRNDLANLGSPELFTNHSEPRFPLSISSDG